MFRLSFVLFLTLMSALSYSQIISQFNWDSNPVTQAVVGPNATSVSGSAISDVGGVGGTNGLNAGLPKADINMVIPGSPTFDVEGIDVSFDFQREESGGNFFTRGASLSINGAANLSVSYRVDNGSGGFNTVTSGNAYAIPNDNTFRNYRFVYLPVSGEGFLMVNGAVVWTNDGPDNRAMYWVGAGNVTVGAGLDGTGNNDTFLDNLIVASVTYSPLPIELLSFNAQKNSNNRTVELTWKTASEINNDYFSIQRSINGLIWDEISTLDGAGNSSTQLNYFTVDYGPLIGLSYYRLQQIDFDGKSSFSPIMSVNFIPSDSPVIYPNPIGQNEFLVIQFPDSKNLEKVVSIISIDGRVVFDYEIEIVNNQMILKLGETISKGIYLIQFEDYAEKIIVQ